MLKSIALSAALVVAGFSVAASAAPPVAPRTGSADPSFIVQVQSKQKAGCTDRCHQRCLSKKNPAKCEPMCVAKKC